MADLGPPMTDAERQKKLSERISRKGHTYDLETIERIRTLIDMGASYREVFERVEASNMDCLRSICSKHKMKSRKRGKHGNRSRLYPETQVREAVERGASYADLVERFGFPSDDCARSFVHRHRLGKVTALKLRFLKQEKILSVWKLARKQVPLRQIAVRLHCTPGSVAGMIWGYDLRNIKRRPRTFKRKFGTCEQKLLPGGHSPKPAAGVAAGSEEFSTPEPACYSIRGVSLAYV